MASSSVSGPPCIQLARRRARPRTIHCPACVFRMKASGRFSWVPLLADMGQGWLHRTQAILHDLDLPARGQDDLLQLVNECVFEVSQPGVVRPELQRQDAQGMTVGHFR